MNHQRTPLSIYGLAILILLVFAVIILVDYQFASQRPGGYHFIEYWSSARAFLNEGKSPYSASTQQEIRLQAGELSIDNENQSFYAAYPLYGIPLFLPFALSPNYFVARLIWIVTLQAALGLLVWFSIKVTAWRTGQALGVLVLLFALTNVYSVIPVITGNVVVIVACLLVAALNAVRSGLDELAGILLAFSTILTPPVLLLLLFILYWAASSRRWRLFAWMTVSWLLLIAASMLLIPDWPLQYSRTMIQYFQGARFTTLGSVLRTWWPGLGAQMGLAISGLLALILAAEWWLARKGDVRHMLWTASLTLVASHWIGIPTSAENAALLLFPLFVVFATLEEHWGPRMRIATLVMMLVLLVGLWAFVWSDINQPDLPLSFPELFFPLPMFLLVGLYWVRWRAIRPQRLLLSELRARGEA
ncbi:MAG: DUF2029 domain-containing protein [Chloroflexi bacterium]|nr:MAG: DUF2029 domain-containing protein [Chloroflexota bacterium]